MDANAVNAHREYNNNKAKGFKSNPGIIENANFANLTREVSEESWLVGGGLSGFQIPGEIMRAEREDKRAEEARQRETEKAKETRSGKPRGAYSGSRKPNGPSEKP